MVSFVLYNGGLDKALKQKVSDMTDQIDDRLDDLEQDVAEIKLELNVFKQTLAMVSEFLKTLAEQNTPPTEADADVYERYRENRSENRSVAIASDIVAIFAHYNVRKNLPVKTVASAGLLSVGKAYGIASWDLQYLHDFLVVHKVMHIYENASEMPELVEQYPALAGLNNKL